MVLRLRISVAPALRVKVSSSPLASTGRWVSSYEAPEPSEHQTPNITQHEVLQNIQEEAASLPQLAQSHLQHSLGRGAEGAGPGYHEGSASDQVQQR